MPFIFYVLLGQPVYASFRVNHEQTAQNLWNSYSFLKRNMYSKKKYVHTAICKISPL